MSLFSNMRGFLSFAIIVVFSVIRIVNVKNIREGCLSLDDDDFQFDAWLRAMAPKFSKKKSHFSQSKPREEDDDEIHVSPLLVEKSNEMAIRRLLDGPRRNFIEKENSKSPNP